ncbi:MAG TPA: hypothetical protein VF695_11045, partial [Sphingomonas sp.]
MDDDTAPNSEDTPDGREQALIEPVSIDELEAVDLNAMTANVRRLDRHVLVDLFRSELITAN